MMYSVVIIVLAPSLWLVLEKRDWVLCTVCNDFNLHCLYIIAISLFFLLIKRHICNCTNCVCVVLLSLPCLFYVQCVAKVLHGT